PRGPRWRGPEPLERSRAPAQHGLHGRTGRLRPRIRRRSDRRRRPQHEERPPVHEHGSAGPLGALTASGLRFVAQLSGEDAHSHDVHEAPVLVDVLAVDALSLESEPLVGPEGPGVILEDVKGDLVEREPVEAVPQDDPHRLGPVPLGPERRLADHDPDLRLPVDAVDLVQSQISDVLTFDLDREDLLVRPPFVVAEPSLLLGERHRRIAAEEPDDLRIREPLHAPPQVQNVSRTLVPSPNSHVAVRSSLPASWRLARKVVPLRTKNEARSDKVQVHVVGCRTLKLWNIRCSWPSGRTIIIFAGLSPP